MGQKFVLILNDVIRLEFEKSLLPPCTTLTCSVVILMDLEPWQTSVMELFFENSSRFKRLYFVVIYRELNLVVKGPILEGKRTGSESMFYIIWRKHEPPHKKWSFPFRISSVNVQETADLVTFTEEILKGKHHFLVRCAETNWNIFLLFL